MKNLFVVLLLSVSVPVFSQDKIVFRDGHVEDGKITEITPSEIKYKKSGMPDGPTYSVYKREVNSLVYQNGHIELVTEKNGSAKEVVRYKNRIAASYFVPYIGGSGDFNTFTTFGIWYERRLIPHFAVKVPFEINVSPTRQSYVLGLMPKFYFNKNKIVQGFAGPEFLFGAGERAYYHYPSVVYRHTFMNTITGNIGVSVNPIERLNLTAEAGLGACIYTYPKTNLTTDAGIVFKLGLGVGYNF